MKLWSSLLFSVLLMTRSYALVDYSESESEFRPKSATPTPRIKKRSSPKIKKVRSSRRSPSKGGGQNIFLGSSYENMDVSSFKTGGQLSRVNIAGHFQTPFNVSLGAEYWHVLESKGYGYLTEDKGNASVILGLNWLKFGNKNDGTTIDILAGMSFGQANSTFATSRTDKIVGVETNKSFYQFALGLGFKYLLTGAVTNPEEMEIGNIRKLYAFLSWRATQDIRFLAEAGTNTVGAKRDVMNGLSEDITFGYFTPKLNLGVGQSVFLELGALFRTKRMQKNDVIRARLYDLKGAYGNSLTASLNIAF